MISDCSPTVLNNCFRKLSRGYLVFVLFFKFDFGQDILEFLEHVDPASAINVFVALSKGVIVVALGSERGFGLQMSSNEFFWFAHKESQHLYLNLTDFRG
eukprot:gnl/MRDRNA2_/MRDRNA2_41839_c0_seq1.p2 gnl/MRDRNA2_/MRDRNA2_41839_c0~~gnl/MRDRNA2_/MRDRNA2_41839_c0_seq1.p2  ORF type:complete len:100 (-),score=8.12 gnl/MRDRNA2_/MRDRNA2_41839_c0_seq1:33-332(-)